MSILQKKLKEIIIELDAINSLTEPWLQKGTLHLDFLTLADGCQVYFSEVSTNKLYKFSQLLFKNRANDKIKVALPSYQRVIKEVVADLHKSKKINVNSCFKESVNLVRSFSEKIIEQNAIDTRYVLPIWTVNIDNILPLKVGPVTIYKNTDWLNHIELDDFNKEYLLDNQPVGKEWKGEIINLLADDTIADLYEKYKNTILYKVLSSCNAIAVVETKKYERKYSEKVARLLCKTVLDAFSLAIGNPFAFHYQSLCGERLASSWRLHTFQLDNGKLKAMSSTLTNRAKATMLLTSPKNQSTLSEDIKYLIPYLEYILEGFNSDTHSHSKLCKRWATALDWFAEGGRDNNDAIAIAKFGAALDVLGNGKGCKGILDVISTVIGWSREEPVSFANGDTVTLRRLVKSVYNKGRSQILHGNRYDRLEYFADERGRAFWLARQVLLYSAKWLFAYDGEDSNDAFRGKSKS